MKRLQNEQVEAYILPSKAKTLQARYSFDADGCCKIHVGMGDEAPSPLQIKEIYAKGIKTCLELEKKSCAVDLSLAAMLDTNGILAAVEGLYGGAYKKKNALSGAWETGVALYWMGEGFDQQQVDEARTLARAIIQTRNLVNRPANLLHPQAFAAAIGELAKDKDIDLTFYEREALSEHGLHALLAVGNSADHPPLLAVLRYDGAQASAERLGLVGKGVTVDSGGYCLKSAGSMEGIKGDMAGGAAVAAVVCALAEAKVPINVTAVIPICENRISPSSLLPGDVISSFSGKTIEVLNSDAEGRLILADALSWAARREACTKLIDIATLTGAIWAMLGYVATGVMANDDAFYDQLLLASRASGERFWRMPSFPEYDKLIESELADIRNMSKDGCGAIAAGLFLRAFSDDLPWLHLDIAGTAEHKGKIWEHQTAGATGACVSTLYLLAKHLSRNTEG